MAMMPLLSHSMLAGFFLFAVQPFRLGDRIAVRSMASGESAAASPGPTGGWYEGSCEQVDLRQAPFFLMFIGHFYCLLLLSFWNLLELILHLAFSLEIPAHGAWWIFLCESECVPVLHIMIPVSEVTIPGLLCCRYTIIKNGRQRLYMPNSKFLTSEFMVMEAKKSDKRSRGAGARRGEAPEDSTQQGRPDITRPLGPGMAYGRWGDEIERQRIMSASRLVTLSATTIPSPSWALVKQALLAEPASLSRKHC